MIHQPTETKVMTAQAELAYEQMKNTVRNLIVEINSIKILLGKTDGEVFTTGTLHFHRKDDMTIQEVKSRLSTLCAFGLIELHPGAANTYIIHSDAFSIKSYIAKQIKQKEIELQGMRDLEKVVNDPATYIIPLSKLPD